jgi:hypothetical protein
MGNTTSTAEGLLSAAQTGDIAVLSKVQAENPHNVQAQLLLQTKTGVFKCNKTALHIAVKHGQMAFLQAILGPMVEAVQAEMDDNAYPGRAAAVLDQVLNEQDSRGR